MPTAQSLSHPERGRSGGTVLTLEGSEPGNAWRQVNSPRPGGLVCLAERFGARPELFFGNAQPVAQAREIPA